MSGLVLTEDRTKLMYMQINSGVPYLLLFNQTGSTALSLALNILLMVLIFMGNVTALATCSREIWAFARDRGLPGSTSIGKMYIGLFAYADGCKY